jgi:creatinine amidohydrolase
MIYIKLAIVSTCLFLMACSSQNQKNKTSMDEKVLYEELTPTEFRERIAEAPVAYLPLGTIEWHGEHLPLGSDGLQSKGFFEILARETGGIVYPMMFMGPDRRQVIDEKEYYGMDYSVREESSEFYYPTQQLDGSSYWISDGDFKVIMEAVLKQISRAGFKVLVAHGHGPSTNFLREHTSEWEAKYGLKILHCWGHRDGEGMGIMVDHAAMNETSLVMALRPELVHMEYLSADTTTWPLGVSGKDPRIMASEEKGAEILTIQKERMVRIIREALAEITSD